MNIKEEKNTNDEFLDYKKYEIYMKIIKNDKSIIKKSICYCECTVKYLLNLFTYLKKTLCFYNNNINDKKHINNVLVDFYKIIDIQLIKIGNFIFISSWMRGIQECIQDIDFKIIDDIINNILCDLVFFIDFFKKGNNNISFLYIYAHFLYINENVEENKILNKVIKQLISLCKKKKHLIEIKKKHGFEIMFNNLIIQKFNSLLLINECLSKKDKKFIIKKNLTIKINKDLYLYIIERMIELLQFVKKVEDVNNKSESIYVYKKEYQIEFRVIINYYSQFTSYLWDFLKDIKIKDDYYLSMIGDIQSVIKYFWAMKRNIKDMKSELIIAIKMLKNVEKSL